MDALAPGWFSELGPLWPGQAFSLEVEATLFDVQSPYQRVQVFRSKTYGNVLVLDGVVQVTERDEFAYQEMIALLPLCAHPAPRRVLVVGGGDGGVLREAVRHPGVESVTLCEIDEMVVKASKQFLPTLARGFDHPKVTVVIGDGFEYLRTHTDAFDVIITDSSDPVGPAESLFQREFFELMHKALKSDGVLCTQGESVWLHLDIIEQVLSYCRGLFPVVDYAYTTIPTYPSGQIGFVLCSKRAGHDLRHPASTLPADASEELRYYSPAMHTAAFTLPRFAQRRLGLPA